MSLLTRRPSAHSAGTRDDLDSGPAESVGVGVVPSQEADTGSLRVLMADGGPADPIEELLLAVASGDREAFAALEARIGGLVRTNIRRVLRDASRSEVVTQEFFAEVPREVGGFDPDQDRAQSWLLARAHERAMSGLPPEHAASC